MIELRQSCLELGRVCNHESTPRRTGSATPVAHIKSVWDENTYSTVIPSHMNLSRSKRNEFDFCLRNLV